MGLLISQRRRITLLRGLIFLTLASFLLLGGCSSDGEDEVSTPAAIQDTRLTSSPVVCVFPAKSIKKPGLQNLYQVSEDLYRGAQPDEEGFRQLEAMGIQTVVNLHAWHADLDMMKDTNLRYEHIPMTVLNPKDDDVVRFLQIVTDKKRTPVFVHCEHGSDRTGTLVAIYRIVVCGWSKDEAIKEMTEGEFGFHEIWQNLVTYIEKLDIEEIKRRAGVS